jgi:chemotaxis family two-component system response regulator PixG
MAEFLPVTTLIDHLQELKADRFSGECSLRDKAGNSWQVYFYLGRLIYITGGIQPVRRWLRSLSAYCYPNQNIYTRESLVEFTDTSILDANCKEEPWEYYLLLKWIDLDRIQRSAALQMIQAASIECLFDVFQAKEIAWKDVVKDPISPTVGLFEIDRAIAHVHHQWQAWQQAGLSPILPASTPFLVRPEKLQESLSPAAYQALSGILNGKHTLLEAAAKKKCRPQDLATALLPHIQAGTIEIREGKDFILPPRVRLPTPQDSLSADMVSASLLSGNPKSFPEGILNNTAVTANKRVLNDSKPLILCIDDSPLVCEQVTQILSTAGYRCQSVNDGFRAMSFAVKFQPALIFLDLVMPHTNGYEVCGRLRKVASFQDTPIVILTGNNTIIDRVRAKVVGATDFIGKPVDPETLLSIARKYLQSDLAVARSS